MTESHLQATIKKIDVKKRVHARRLTGSEIDYLAEIAKKYMHEQLARNDDIAPGDTIVLHVFIDKWSIGK